MSKCIFVFSVLLTPHKVRIFRNKAASSSQVSDTRTYARTLTKLELLNPVEILVPLGALSGESAGCGGGAAGSGPSTLYRDLKEVCPGTTLTQVQRKYFSETRGLAEIRDANGALNT